MTELSQSVNLHAHVEECQEGGYFAQCKEMTDVFAEGETLEELQENMGHALEDALFFRSSDSAIAKQHGEIPYAFDMQLA